MLKFVAKRIGYAILTLFLIITATFFPDFRSARGSDCLQGRSDAGAGAAADS
jgi:hypothetical protein